MKVIKLSKKSRFIKQEKQIIAIKSEYLGLEILLFSSFILDFILSILNFWRNQLIFPN
jgi:hypothetical protein